MSGRQANKKATHSKSLAVIVKLPSLADSSVIYPADSQNVLLKSESPEKDRQPNKSIKSVVGSSGYSVKKFASKSLKLSEVRMSETQGKTSFSG